MGAVQSSVRALLGVNVDAFEAEQPVRARDQPTAEMDIDGFLVEAKGAGIREAFSFRATDSPGLKYKRLPRSGSGSRSFESH